MDIRFDGQVAWMSGAASGMGLLFAKDFVTLGGSVVMSDVNPETLRQAVAEINAIREGAAIGTVCDVRSYEDVVRADRRCDPLCGRRRAANARGLRQAGIPRYSDRGL